MFTTTLLFGVLAFLPPVLSLPTDTTALHPRAYVNPPRSVNYVQTFHKYGSNDPLDLKQLKAAGANYVNLAALHVNAVPGDIRLNDVNPNDTMWDQVWSDVAYLQQNGVKVMMMIGGAAAGSYPRLCGTKTPAVIPLYSTLKYHNLDGVDLDIEESVDISCALALLRRFDKDFGSDFILTMAPVASALMGSATAPGPGLSGFNYFTLDSQATSSTRASGRIVNWYNAQFYNGWGSARTPDHYWAIITSGWSADRVVMGVLDSPGDAGSGFYNLTTLQNTWCQLEQYYSSFPGGCGWEYWDAGQGESPKLADPYDWVGAVTGYTVTKRCAASSAPVSKLGLPPPDVPDPQDTKYLQDKYGINVFQAVYALNTTSYNLALAEPVASTLPKLVGGIWDLLESLLGGVLDDVFA